MGGRFREARKLKDLLLVKGSLPGIELYHGLIVGRWKWLKKLLVEFCNKGLSLNFETQHNSSWVLYDGECKKASVEWMEKMTEHGWEPYDELYKSKITCLSSKERFVEAFQIKDHSTCKLLIDELKRLKDRD